MSPGCHQLVTPPYAVRKASQNLHAHTNEAALETFSECGARVEGAQCNRDTSQGSASLLEGFEAPKQRVLRAKCFFSTLFGTRLGPGRDPAGTRINRLREPLHPLWDGPAHRSVPHERRATRR